MNVASKPQGRSQETTIRKHKSEKKENYVVRIMSFVFRSLYAVPVFCFRLLFSVLCLLHAWPTALGELRSIFCIHSFCSFFCLPTAFIRKPTVRGQNDKNQNTHTFRVLRCVCCSPASHFYLWSSVLASVLYSSFFHPPTAHTPAKKQYDGSHFSCSAFDHPTPRPHPQPGGGNF